MVQYTTAFARCGAALAILNCAAPLAAAYSDNLKDLLHARQSNDTEKPDERDFFLRIMNIGDATAIGDPETTDDDVTEDGNGYRKYLRDHLRSEGWQVNMVGSQSGGDMDDNVSGGPRLNLELVVYGSFS